MTIDEICKEISENGFKNLNDEEIQTYVDYQRELALRDADFKDRCAKREAELQTIAEAQFKVADAAIDSFKTLCAAPLNLKRVDNA